MPEDKSCKLLQPSRSSDKKKKRTQRGKKATAAQENTEKTQPASLGPETSPVSLQPLKLRASSKKDGEHLSGIGCRSKTPHKDSPTPPTTTHKTKAPWQGYVTEISDQVKESLRWEGVLMDPQAEAKRLEQYRANRRQRYIAHREALFKETQDALR
ncbi:protein LIAT1 [Brachyistius frenatus]|uniref:protein LIAT1 n=1 Tax=Brachyistius frenatus TaxID=100188 RepID=UPI0037E9AEF1